VSTATSDSTLEPSRAKKSLAPGLEADPPRRYGVCAGARTSSLKDRT
jgi:hypothetical protein